MNLLGMQSMLVLSFTKVLGLLYVFFSDIFLLLLPTILVISKDLYLVIILFIEFAIVVYRVFYLYKKGILHALFRY